jgi:hypothetical protein
MPPRRSARPVRRSSSEAQGGGLGNWVGVALVAISAVIVIAAIWFFVINQDSLVELNATDLCPKDRSQTVPGVYVVLVDQTDLLPELQRRSVANAVLAQMRSDLETQSTDWRHARVEIWTFGDQTGRSADDYDVGGVKFALSKALTICNPGSPERWDHLYKNADVIRHQHRRFYADVESKILQSLTFPEAKQSPVLEAVYGIGVRVFSAQTFRDARKRLILVSDLMQNTRSLSFFVGPIDYDHWKKRRDARLSKPELRDVVVVALMIPGARPDLQRASLARFWASVFTEAGVRDDDQQLRRIQ